jgi:hypothetical protein
MSTEPMRFPTQKKPIKVEDIIRQQPVIRHTSNVFALKKKRPESPSKSFKRMNSTNSIASKDENTGVSGLLNATLENLNSALKYATTDQTEAELVR